MSRNISKLDQVLEALYLIYGGSGKTQIYNNDGDETTVEGQIISIEIREDATNITELYEPGNSSNIVGEFLINSPSLLKGVDSLVNGTKGFSKVVFDAGSLKVNFKS